MRLTSQWQLLTPMQKAWGAYIGVSIIWGTTYPAIKVAVAEFEPFMLSGLRHIIAALIFIVVCAFMKLPLPSKQDMSRLFVAGLFMVVGGNGFVCWAEQSIPSGNAAIISGFYPLLNVAMAIIMLRERINTWVFSGMIIGFVGVILMFYDGISGLTDSKYMFGNGLILMAVLFWTFGSLYLKRYPVKCNLYYGIGWQMLFASFINLGISFYFEDNAAIGSYSIKAWSAMFYLVFFGSIAGYVFFYYMLEHLPAAQISTYSYWNTIISVAIGVLFLKEVLRWNHFAALSFTIGGALLARYGFKLLRLKKEAAV